MFLEKAYQHNHSDSIILFKYRKGAEHSDNLSFAAIQGCLNPETIPLHLIFRLKHHISGEYHAWEVQMLRGNLYLAACGPCWDAWNFISVLEAPSFEPLSAAVSQSRQAWPGSAQSTSSLQPNPHFLWHRGLIPPQPPPNPAQEHRETLGEAPGQQPEVWITETIHFQSTIICA